MTEELDIILTGFELEQSQVEAGIVRVFGVDPMQVRRLLRELPAVAKTGASRALAERYAAALNSVGARVELRPTGSLTSPAHAPGTVSLPAPAAALIARVDESMRVQRETARAIKRFRAAEGLEAESFDAVDPDNPGLDLWNPAIPKAPLVPLDLARMRNAARTRMSDPPNWLTDPQEQDNLDLEPARAHNDAQRPPSVESSRIAHRASQESNASQASDPSHAPHAPHAESRPSNHSAVRPRTHSVGLAHAATASVRPGLTSFYAGPAESSPRKLLRVALPMIVVLLLVAGALAYWLSGRVASVP